MIDAAEGGFDAARDRFGASLVSQGFDFESSFPAPDDAALRHAGRQGPLDQKASADITDADWVALQHHEWLRDIFHHLSAHAYLVACLRSYRVAETGAAPRSSATWNDVARRMGREMVQHLAYVDGVFGSYADHFGVAAAEAFRAYASARDARRRIEGPAQGSLF